MSAIFSDEGMNSLPFGGAFIEAQAVVQSIARGDISLPFRRGFH